MGVLTFLSLRVRSKTVLPKVETRPYLHLDQIGASQASMNQQNRFNNVRL